MIYKNRFRNLVSGVDTKIPLGDGRLVTAVNFDNAATTPPFVSVLKEIISFAPWYSSVHRGDGYKSKVSSDAYERARLAILNFINADTDCCTVIFVKNTTEALNKLSYRLCDGREKCVVLSTSMEHHSNDLPWRNKYRVDYIALDDCGRLSMEDLENKLKKYNGHVRLVTITGASNVTGYINPIYEAAALAHKYKTKICVDGAQLVPHMQVSMKSQNPAENIDYLAFSAHKMYAPFGIGVLIGPREDFTKGEPDYVGGGTVKIVTPEVVKWEDPPQKEEAGSPNVIGVVALNAAIRTMKMIGMKNMESYEKSLARYALKRLKEVPDIRLYGDQEKCEGRVGIIPFNIRGMHHSLISKVLSDEAGIAVRSGCFCAQPYVQKLLKIGHEELGYFVQHPDSPRPGMVRVSFGIYNEYWEIDRLVEILKTLSKDRACYMERYGKYVNR